jgi:hypothetical protein
LRVKLGMYGFWQGASGDQCWDLEETWTAEDGGALELYPLVEGVKVKTVEPDIEFVCVLGGGVRVGGK